MTRKIRLALADDHDLLLEGIARLLTEEKQMEVCITSSNGIDLVDQIPKQKPDVVMLDITMPGKDGAATAAEILRRFPDIRIIMLTMHQEPAYVLPLVDLGVHGFLLKSTSRAEMVAAIHLVMQGKRYFTEEVVQIISRRNLREAGEEIRITRREREIVQMMYEGFSALEVAERLFISQYTVFKHRQNLLQKCRCKNAAQLINLAISKGWVNVGPK